MPKIIQAKGKSMRPLLRDGDLFLLEDSPDLSLFPMKPGCLLYVETPEGPLLHRYLGNAQLKGDRNKDPDYGWKVLGQVTARFHPRNGSTRLVPYDRPLLRALHRVQAALSRGNRRGHPLHRFFSLLSYLFAAQVRFLENRL